MSANAIIVYDLQPLDAREMIGAALSRNLAGAKGSAYAIYMPVMADRVKLNRDEQRRKISITE